MLKIDKEKYNRIVRTEGINAALTALHQDTNTWEGDTFEGPRGYQPAMWDELKAVREFSRELWDLSLSRPELIGRSEKA